MRPHEQSFSELPEAQLFLNMLASAHHTNGAAVLRARAATFNAITE
jgi:hypothetical protein